MNPKKNIEPQVSVVVTTHNRWGWLKKCVASVQYQQGVALELIVIDDGSDDGTWAWLCEKASERLRTHRFEENAERCAARNQGLAMARGPYVMFLDDDDWLWPNALQGLSRALDEHPDAVAAIGARWTVFYGEGRERRDSHPRLQAQKDIRDELYFGWTAVSGQNLFRTETVRAVGGWGNPAMIPCEDRLLWMRLAAQGPVVLWPEVTMSWRYHAGQGRPPNIIELRDAVVEMAVSSLPDKEQKKALRLRRSGRLVELAEDEMSGGNPLTGLWLTMKAVAASPRIFTSRLIGGWTLRRLGGGLLWRLRPGRKTGGKPGPE